MNNRMTEDEFHDILKATAYQFDLYATSETVDNIPGSFASANPYTNHIRVSAKAFEKCDYQYMLMVIRHELAHLIVAAEIRKLPKKERVKVKSTKHIYSHDRIWKEAAANISVFKEELYPYSKRRHEVAQRLHSIPSVTKTTKTKKVIAIVRLCSKHGKNVEGIMEWYWNPRQPEEIGQCCVEQCTKDAKYYLKMVIE